MTREQEVREEAIYGCCQKLIDADTSEQRRMWFEVMRSLIHGRDMEVTLRMERERLERALAR